MANITGMRLQQLRREAGFTGIQLADILGVSKQTISCWETGKIEMDYSTLNKIADLFHVSIDYLLGRTNIKNETLDESEEKKYKAPDYIGTYEEAVEFLSSLNLLRAYGGLDINQKTEEEIINLARTIHSVLKMQGAI